MDWRLVEGEREQAARGVGQTIGKGDLRGGREHDETAAWNCHSGAKWGSGAGGGDEFGGEADGTGGPEAEGEGGGELLGVAGNRLEIN